jgi:hypothetical protein
LIRFHWDRFRRPKIIRCPYCVENEDFRVMIAQAGGDWFLCGNCGHLALPTNPLFQCTCNKCAGITHQPLKTIRQQQDL